MDMHAILYFAQMDQRESILYFPYYNKEIKYSYRKLLNKIQE